jgi:hypothetical protein
VQVAGPTRRSSSGLFGAVTLMVTVTTYLTTPLLKWLCKDGHPGKVREETEGI